MIRKQSKNKCYPSNVSEVSLNGSNYECYPKFGDPLIFENENRVVRYDQFSKASVVTSSFGYEKEDDKLCITMDGIDAAKMGLGILRSSIDAIETELYTRLKYKYLYQLTLMILKKQIDRVELYCTNTVSSNIDNPMYGKYIITVSGMLENKCKLDFQVITDFDFKIHPASIITMIEKESKDLPIEVVIDEDSFNRCIKQMQHNNPYNKDSGLTQIDIQNALKSIDKYNK